MLNYWQGSPLTLPSKVSGNCQIKSNVNINIQSGVCHQHNLRVISLQINQFRPYLRHYSIAISALARGVSCEASRGKFNFFMFDPE